MRKVSVWSWSDGKWLDKNWFEWEWLCIENPFEYEIIQMGTDWIRNNSDVDWSGWELIVYNFYVQSN